MGATYLQHPMLQGVSLAQTVPVQPLPLWERLFSRATEKGFELFVQRIGTTLGSVSSEVDVDMRTEALLGQDQWIVRQWMTNIDRAIQNEAVDRTDHSSAGIERPSHIPLSVHLLDTIMLERASSFSRWMERHSARLPNSLAKLGFHASTRNFHRAFFDDEIPASIRRAYLANRKGLLVRISLRWLEDNGPQDQSIARAALESALLNAQLRELPLVLGLPGAPLSGEWPEGIEEIAPLNIGEEEDLWRKYILRSE